MDSHFEDLLRGHLERLFKNEHMSIADFQQWFMTAWWEAEDGASESLFEFGSRIEHLLYIWSSGEWNDAAFLLDIQLAAGNYYGSEPVAQVVSGIALPSTAIPTSSASFDPTFAVPEKRITTGSTGSVFVLALDGPVGVDVISRGLSPAQVHRGRPRQVLAAS